MNVLVTGAAGYLGTWVCRDLLVAGHRVLALDSLRYNQQSLVPFCINDRFTFLRGDVRDYALLDDVLGSVDAVIPLAAVVGAPACDRCPSEATAINYEAIAHLMAAKEDRQRVLFPTTNSGYGAQSREYHCTEETPLEPLSHYARTKAWAEEEVVDRPNSVSFRLATLFGVSPRMRMDLLVNDFVHQAFLTGALVLYEKHVTRNFVAVRDVSQMFCWALACGDALQDNVYNVGLDSANMTKEELAQRIRKQLPGTALFESDGADPDKRDYRVSSDRLRRAGWEATRTVEDGIMELIKAYGMYSRFQAGNV